MWGEDGILGVVLIASLLMGIGVVAGFVFFEGAATWVVVALLIVSWLATLRVFGRRYEQGRWPFGRANPY